MLRLAADENFHGAVVHGLRLRIADLDIVRAQDTTVSGADDPAILEWAAREGRVLLTHDVTTLIGYAYGRVSAGQPMPGVIAVTNTTPIGHAIDDIMLVVEASAEGEWDDRVLFLPL